MRALVTYIRQFWSTTSFEDRELNLYAKRLILDETRHGVMGMSLLLLGLIISALPVYVELKLHSIYLYTYLLIAILCLHIFFSARKMEDIKVLHLLGITLLTISATAFVSIAHQTQGFSVLLFANIVLLFMAVPMVPWGIREASSVIFIVYALLTLSTGGVANRFGSETLLVLQFFMIAAAITSIILVARNTRIRKDDLSTRYDLEKAQAHLYQLSNVDPLTGAWNRRYLPTAISQLFHKFSAEAEIFYYALFDLDDFKLINDDLGHDFGDQVLKCIGEKFSNALEGKGYLLRFGGDEFVVLVVDNDPKRLIDKTILEIKHEFENNPYCTLPVTISYGLVSAPLCSDATLSSLYHRADKSLYENKKKQKNSCDHITFPQVPA